MPIQRQRHDGHPSAVVRQAIGFVRIIQRTERDFRQTLVHITNEADCCTDGVIGIAYRHRIPTELCPIGCRIALCREKSGGPIVAIPIRIRRTHFYSPAATCYGQEDCPCFLQHLPLVGRECIVREIAVRTTGRILIDIRALAIRHALLYARRKGNPIRCKPIIRQQDTTMHTIDRSTGEEFFGIGRLKNRYCHSLLVSVRQVFAVSVPMTFVPQSTKVVG